MKILYLVGGTGVCGGVRVIWAHLEQLQRLGHTVAYGTLDGSTKMDWLKGDIPVMGVNHLLDDQWDVVVATGYETWPVAHCSFTTQRKFGFVQMKESLFLSNLRPNIADRHFSIPIGQVITISRWLKEYLEIECGQENVLIIPNGVDTSLFYPDPQPTLRPRFDRVALVIGHQLNEAKNVTDAVAAINKAGTFEIWHVSPLPMDDIGAHKTYVNPPQHVIRHLYSTADVFVMSSRFEGRTCLAPESMACGCPVVAMHHEGVDDLIGHARIVEKGNIDALAEAIADVFLDPKKTEKLKTKAYEYVHTELRWDKIGKELEKIYAGCLTSSRRKRHKD